ncbi:DUF2975 domain-containing protein [Virgibacillus sp. SK37]|uniref:DUF2975 domain-containing protein n=1 Tax=Virgibacillus sp. SK37 TaxID=403957 RepID=UPI0004D0D282|nr:DUF2975 domain-containing protein [Virgibacillus sp. SK37]AIF42134.1 membrane protein [Virgibacillus sp. SK37]
MQRVIIPLFKTAIIIMGLFVFIFGFIGLPQLAEKAATLNPEYAHLQYPILIGIELTAIPFFIALHQVYVLLKLMEKKAAFSDSAHHRLKRIKFCALFIAVMYIAGSLYLSIQSALHPGVAIIGIAIILTTLMISVFAVMLQKLLIRAKEMKVENELTV